MSEQPFDSSGPRSPEEQLEARLHQTARAFRYPPTPDIAGAVRQRLTRTPRSALRRRVAWVIILLLISLCMLLAVPQVRAAILNLLRLGGVIIVLEQPTATPMPAQTTTPIPTSTPIRSLLDLAGETTLDQAQQSVRFPIRWPNYPANLPDRVYRQDIDGAVIVLVWIDPKHVGGIRYSLHILDEGALVYKMKPKVIQETTIHGQRAIWTEGPYILQWQRGKNAEWEMRRIVRGNVLIWMDGKLTYRLETDSALEEAVRVAESVPRITP
jgi:hypothetical protein